MKLIHFWIKFKPDETKAVNVIFCCFFFCGLWLIWISLELEWENKFPFSSSLSACLFYFPAFCDVVLPFVFPAIHIKKTCRLDSAHLLKVKRNKPAAVKDRQRYVIRRNVHVHVSVVCKYDKLIIVNNPSVSLKWNKDQQLLSRAVFLYRQSYREINPLQKRHLSNHLFIDLFELVASQLTGGRKTTNFTLTRLYYYSCLCAMVD